MRAGVERRVLGVDLCVFDGRKRPAEDLGGDPAKNRADPLSDLHGSSADQYLARMAYLDLRQRLVAGPSSILQADAQSDAPPPPLRRASIADESRGFDEPRIEVAIETTVTRRIRNALGQHVPAPKLQRVETQTARDHVDLRFRRKARLGATKSPE